jgi:hypothetical protein
MGRLALDPTRVLYRETAGEVVVIDLATSSYLGVNESGACLWPLLADGCTHEELVDRLVAEFAIPHETATQDVGAFLAGLRERGFVREYATD